MTRATDQLPPHASPYPPVRRPGHRSMTLRSFLDLVGDDLGLDLEGPAVATVRLADLPRWDSVHLLRLVVLLERESGRRVPVRKILEAQSLKEIHALMEEQG